MILRIFTHELRLILREPRFWIPFLIPPIFMVIMQMVVLAQYGGAAQVMNPGILLIIAALLSTMSVTLTADSFAGERERNTLELLLCLPLSIRQLFLGKLFAVLPVPLVLMGLSELLMWELMGTESLAVLAKAVLFGFSTCLLITGISLLVSLFANSVRSAAQGNVIFVLALLMGTQAIAPNYFESSTLPFIICGATLLVFFTLVALGLKRFSARSMH